MTPQQEAAFAALGEISPDALDSLPEVELPEPDALGVPEPDDLPAPPVAVDEFPAPPLDLPEWPESPDLAAELPDLPPSPPPGGGGELPGAFPAPPVPEGMAEEFRWPGERAPEEAPPAAFPETGESSYGASAAPADFGEADVGAAPNYAEEAEGQGGPDLLGLLQQIAAGIAALGGQRSEAGGQAADFRFFNPQGPIQWPWQGGGSMTPEQAEDYGASAPSMNVTSLNGARGAGGWGFGSRAEGNSATDRTEPSRRVMG